MILYCNIGLAGKNKNTWKEERSWSAGTFQCCNFMVCFYATVATAAADAAISHWMMTLLWLLRKQIYQTSLVQVWLRGTNMVF